MDLIRQDIYMVGLIRQDISRRTADLFHLDIYTVDLIRRDIHNQRESHICQN